jgi:RHS repeat-associated protein
MISNLLGTTTYDLKSNSNALWKITRQTPQSRLTQYSYNQYTGNLSRMDRANNTYTTFDFDNLDRLKSYTTHLTTDNTHVYDYVSDDFGSVHDTNLIQQTTYPVSGTYYQYNYDDLYRLANEYGFTGGVPAYTKNYYYDSADNRSRVTNGTVDTYTVNNLNEVTAIDTGNTSFGYDLNGNLTQKTANGMTSTLEYDYENRLVKINYPSQAGGGWTEFVYDALGRRLKTIEKNSQGQITGESHCVYDSLDLIADLNGLDALVAAYTHGPGFDDPLICRYNNADYYYHTNHQGSVTELLNQTGGIVKTYRYDAFGNILQETGPAWNRGFTYTGRERHYRSGLYYYRARWYDSQTGRFTTQDPIYWSNGTNLYAYVWNDPVNCIDPLGLEVLNPQHYPISDIVLHALQEFNAYIGMDSDVVITGGNRRLDCNLGAGKKSTHVEGLAADIYVPGQPHILTANQAKDSGIFCGIGWYEEGYRGPHGEGPHVHVDLREKPATWGYDWTGKYYRRIPDFFER